MIAAALLMSSPFVAWSPSVRSRVDHALEAIPHLQVLTPASRRASIPAAPEQLHERAAQACERVGPDGAVLVYDASLSDVDQTAVTTVLRVLHQHGCDTVVPALPTIDTLKFADAAGTVRSTLQRDAIRVLQLPQAYRAAALHEALRAADPQALRTAHERGDHGYVPSLVTGDVRVVEL